MPSQHLAPYLPSGCIAPRRFSDLLVISRKVSVALSKPDSASEEITATLVIEGTDWSQPANWTVSNADALPSSSPWLQLPSTGGMVAGAQQLPITLLLSAVGLREQAAPYEETLLITVRSAIEAVEHTQPLQVSLTVQARTHIAVWGRILNGSCEQSSSSVLSIVEVGVLHRVAFTACDVDSLPVDHQLPSQTDSRSFLAILHAALGADRSVRIEYAGAGVYDAIVSLASHGPFDLSLELDQDTVLELSGRAVCPINRVALLSGRCGCKAGSSQLSELEPCEPCKHSTSSADGATGREGCNVCEHGFFRPHATSPASECVACIEKQGITCSFNSTIETVNLTQQYWRESAADSKVLSECLAHHLDTCFVCLAGHSTSTMEIWRCKRSGSWSPCEGGSDAGGDGTGYCAAGYRGPRCELCDSATRYFDKLDVRCRDCGNIAVKAIAVLCSLAFLILAASASDAVLGQ
eukprot:7387302-Prymnesium_polylepis.1